MEYAQKRSPSAGIRRLDQGVAAAAAMHRAVGFRVLDFGGRSTSTSIQSTVGTLRPSFLCMVHPLQERKACYRLVGELQCRIPVFLMDARQFCKGFCRCQSCLFNKGRSTSIHTSTKYAYERYWIPNRSSVSQTLPCVLSQSTCTYILWGIIACSPTGAVTH